MNLSEEGRIVLKRFCAIAFAIPAVLLAFVSAAYLSPWAVNRAEVSTATLNIALSCLACAGLGIWAFFSFVLYGRLWKVFPHIGDRDKGWSYAQGVFGLLGVGTMMSSVLGVFFYLFSGDFYRSIVLFALSLLLAAGEAIRFPTRIADVEDIIEGAA